MVTFGTCIKNTSQIIVSFSNPSPKIVILIMNGHNPLMLVRILWTWEKIKENALWVDYDDS